MTLITSTDDSKYPAFSLAARFRHNICLPVCTCTQGESGRANIVNQCCQVLTTFPAQIHLKKSTGKVRHNYLCYSICMQIRAFMMYGHYLLSLYLEVYLTMEIVMCITDKMIAFKAMN